MGIELLVVFIIISGLFLIILNVVTVMDNNKIVNKAEMDAKTAVDKISFEINNLYLLGDGANSSLLLPGYLDNNVNYTLNVYPEEHVVEIQFNGKRYLGQVITGDVNYSSTGKNIKLENRKGRIYAT